MTNRMSAKEYRQMMGIDSAGDVPIIANRVFQEGNSIKYSGSENQIGCGANKVLSVQIPERKQ